jgi:EAL domain-containing protein (putative c-di-GMP-specific phosphodiesterase class I)
MEQQWKATQLRDAIDDDRTIAETGTIAPYVIPPRLRPAMEFFTTSIYQGQETMPLQQLVEHFNYRLGSSPGNPSGPFVLKNGAVHGVYGPIQIGSQLSPVRLTDDPAQIAGYAAKQLLTNSPLEPLGGDDIEHLLGHPLAPSIDTLSILNFDRLLRTVHMLNYLLVPTQAENDTLFLDVDPRHILGVKENHGVYFEEIIVRCGLETRNVAIQVPVTPAYARFQQQLNQGLENYRSRGYQIALKFEYAALGQQSTHLIRSVEPNYVSLSTRLLDKFREARAPEKLRQLNALVRSIGGRSILANVAHIKSSELVRNMGFELVEGEFYGSLSYSESPSENAVA